jgi:hypothetical protein
MSFLVLSVACRFVLLKFQAGAPMSGIAALAAAAAATQKISTSVSGLSGVTSTHMGGIKVVNPTIVSPSGIKMTQVQGALKGELISCCDRY